MCPGNKYLMNYVFELGSLTVHYNSPDAVENEVTYIRSRIGKLRFDHKEGWIFVSRNHKSLTGQCLKDLLALIKYMNEEKQLP